MTQEHFDYMLRTTPGIGVKATTNFGTEQLFFYEDFDGPTTGIDRAMKQLYPQLNAGKYTKLVFVENGGQK